MRRNLKKLSCAMLCICLLLINAPGSMSYAENTEQNATYTDADTDTTTENADVPETEEITQVATATDVEDIDSSSATATDELLYAASSDEYSIVINSQEDWNNMFNHSAGDGSGWMSGAPGQAMYIGEQKSVKIILNTDITLSQMTTLTIPPLNNVQKKFQLDGNSHSIDIAQKGFMIQEATDVAIENTHFQNGTVQVQNYIKFCCTDSQFSAASVELFASGGAELSDIANCDFFGCPGPCINSMSSCPVSFSDCTMNNSGLLFSSSNICSVSFFGIKATNCTGTVIGKTTNSGDSYSIESISDCQFSTSQQGITAIDHNAGTVGKITRCTITGFDTGIKLSGDTVTINDTEITDCITGVDISKLLNKNVMISGLTMTAREGASNTVGYKGSDCLPSRVFDYDFDQMPQINSCKITGFDTGIYLDNCPIVVWDCTINDCNSGVAVKKGPVAIVGTTLTARASAENSGSVTTTGVTGEGKDKCFLIDCDIKDFDIGSDMKLSDDTTIISCRYQNRRINLKSASKTYVYDTSFIGGETSVILSSGSSYFYDCIIQGDAVTQSGFSYGEDISADLYIFNLERPYYIPSNTYYDNLKQYSKKTVKNGKSEIFNCETGINTTGNVYIADTHIHDCVTGIQSEQTKSYGNNLIEDCTDGIKTNSLYRYKENTDTNATFTDIHTDTIRNCLYNGLSSTFTDSDSSGWQNRLEVYNCGNYGIEVKDHFVATVDIHNCKTGIYITADAERLTSLDAESKIYDNREWGVYYSSPTGMLVIQGSKGTLTGGGKLSGNVCMLHTIVTHIYTEDLYSDDSVYYLGTEDGIYKFTVDNLYGTVVFDTVNYKPGRKVAELNNPDFASQMFAKKAGYVISTVTENGVTYAVFAAGCTVTYDVTTNGSDTFDNQKLSDEEIKKQKLPKISYVKENDIDYATHTASKTGYKFVGWNTDKDATEGLVEPLTAGVTDITLYAIYEKIAYINYHTYDVTLDYESDVTFYNNEDKKKCTLDGYGVSGDKTFVGYVFNEDAVVSSDADLMQAGNEVTVSPDGLDVYCVYEKQGQLDYLKKDGTIWITEEKNVYDICSDNNEFEYTVKAGQAVEGFTFKEWKDKDGNSFVAGDTVRTDKDHIVLRPVYEKNAEPTTTEEPTTETPTAEPPIIQPPATETPTTEAPAGPKTGDSTAPIAVIGLGILSLLSLLVLTMKNKRRS